jgi:hypothetical protein
MVTRSLCRQLSTYPTTSFSAPASSAASSALSSTTSRPPPSSGTRMTIPRPSLVTSIGPSPVRGFIAAIAHPHPVVIRQLAGSIIPYHLVAASVGSFWVGRLESWPISPFCCQVSAVRSNLVGPNRRWREASGHMIVDQTDRLHGRVRRRRADEAEPEALQLSGHSN